VCCRAADIRLSAASIAAVQEPSGPDPVFPGGHADPWDHVEAAMALDVAGLHGEAAAAYAWLARAQRLGRLVGGEVSGRLRARGDL